MFSNGDCLPHTTVPPGTVFFMAKELLAMSAEAGLRFQRIQKYGR